MLRIGVGLDSHRIKLKRQTSNAKADRNLILGGVEISKDYYALADSDGDVIIHSLCNALSTAIGGGSLDTWAGKMFRAGVTDSREFLKHIWIKVKNKGFKISNVAIMLEGSRPKMESYRKKIQQNLADLLETSSENIGVAFTTGQDLTAFGKGEGIQVFSTVLLKR